MKSLGVHGETSVNCISKGAVLTYVVFQCVGRGTVRSHGPHMSACFKSMSSETFLRYFVKVRENNLKNKQRFCRGITFP